MIAKITDYKRFAVHDGDGIRTTVFFKGCPLRCEWCHNPETQSFNTEMGFFEHKCTRCGVCASVCPAGAQTVNGEARKFDREICRKCGKCAENCLPKAMTVWGRDTDTEEICRVLLEDRDFYETSGGGITLSGGECLCQADACVEIMKRMKEEGISTAVDTCGYVSRETLDKVIPYTDMFLYDIKHLDSAKHKEGTGVGNERILENLEYLAKCGCKIEIRMPVIPGYNDSITEDVSEYVASLGIERPVKFLKYHNLAQSKYKALGSDHQMPPLK
ncbi:MAG: glycyl-radical enzyme activating protein [Clostridia bacterium]|nr:glycyl-radical enzyme activating protein [Clostridia bacterium]